MVANAGPVPSHAAAAPSAGPRNAPATAAEIAKPISSPAPRGRRLAREPADGRRPRARAAEAGPEPREDQEAELAREAEEDARDRRQAETEEQGRAEAQPRCQQPARERRHQDAGRERAREEADGALRQAERRRVGGQERGEDGEEHRVDEDHRGDEDHEPAHLGILPVAHRASPGPVRSTPLTAPDRRDTTGAVQEASASPPAAREAASVILARDSPGGFEVLLLQRHPNSRFAPGAFAFPGGRVEPADAGPGIEARCRGLARIEAARQLPDVQPAERAIGFWVAALREAFEEAGIFLAYGPVARPVDVASLGDVHAHRARCREDSAAFGRLLTELDLVLATDRAGLLGALDHAGGAAHPLRHALLRRGGLAGAGRRSRTDSKWWPRAGSGRTTRSRGIGRASWCCRSPHRGSSRPSPIIATSTPSGRLPTDGRSGPSARASSATAGRRAHPAPAGPRLVLRPGPRRRIV